MYFLDRIPLTGQVGMSGQDFLPCARLASSQSWQSFMLLQLSHTIRRRWFRIGLNLVMIFVGLELIEYAYATQYYFSESRLMKDLPVLEAMYIAFIAGLFPNYATSIADMVMDVNIRSWRQILAVGAFLLITFLLNVLVIWVSIRFV